MANTITLTLSPIEARRVADSLQESRGITIANGNQYRRDGYDNLAYNSQYSAGKLADLSNTLHALRVNAGFIV